jgi:malate dehydrogenase (oxaloacetate-decarboxylating)(NADP+)
MSQGKGTTWYVFYRFALALKAWVRAVTLTDVYSYAKYIFPGLGLGTILSHASQVTDSMVDASAISLANSVTEEEAADGLIYPRLHRIRDISVEIALGTIRAAQLAVSIISCISLGEMVDPNCVLGLQGVDNAPKLTTMDDNQLREYIKCKQWVPADSYSKL